MILKYCFAAEGVARDADTNELAVFNVFEGVSALAFPLFLRRIAYLIAWEREGNEPEVTNGRFQLILDQNVLTEVAISVDFQGRQQVRTILRIQGPVIPAPGRLHFVAALDNGLRAEYSFLISGPATVVGEAEQPAG